MTPKRRTDVTLELQVDTATEATELAWYLEQRQLAFEWQCVGALIDPAGTLRYGAALLFPRIQWRSIRREDQEDFDTLVLEGRVLDDQVNPVVTGWVANGQGMPYVFQEMLPEDWEYTAPGTDDFVLAFFDDFD